MSERGKPFNVAQASSLGGPGPDSARQRWLRLMLESRLGDLREESLHRQGRGQFHVSGRGHEALCVVGEMLGERDYVVPYYRDRGLMLGRGLTTKQMALEYFAKRDSASAGRMMPSHYCDRERNVVSVATPTGVQLLPACGIAWAMKLDGASDVALTTIGDAATRQGDFYEAVCFALERRLPLWLIVEDNGYGISTPTRKTNPLAIQALRQKTWRMLDGWDADALWRAAEEDLAKLRSGHGPALWWVRLERLSSHTCSDDQTQYRPAKELATLEERDPIVVLRDRLIAEGQLTASEFAEWERALREEVRRTYEEAAQAEDPRAEELHAIVESSVRPGEGSPSRRGRQRSQGDWSAVRPGGLVAGASRRMGDVFNLALREALAADRRCVIFGEDVEDPKGGVFRLTKGLSTDFPSQVFNSPLAESTIVGVAGGMAMHGWRPIFELQFVDFLWPGFHQLVSNLANLRWRSNGQWRAPAIFYAPYGGYLPGGSLWHSQANESALAHFPGLKIGIPSTPEDAAALLPSALRSDDPTLILLPKHLLWKEQNVEGNDPAEMGKSRLVREGKDITVVAWGNTVEIAEEALDNVARASCLEASPDNTRAGSSGHIELPGHVASADLIDLRWIAPWDETAVLASVAKTGRLLIVQEDTANCSVGQMILARVTTDVAVFARLKAPPELIATPPVMIGYSSVYEYAALPSAERVEAALRRMLGQNAMNHGLQAETFTPKEEWTVVVPNFGEGLRGARMARLLRAPGETVERDEALCEVETDKAIFPIEAAEPGILTHWLVAEDNQVSMGQAIAVIRREIAAETDGAPVPPAWGIAGWSSPAMTKRLAAVIPASVEVDCQWAAIQEARVAAKKVLGERAPTPSAMVAWCLIRAQERHPAFRRLIDEYGRLEEPEDFDLGLAVSLEHDGLGAAVVKSANRMNWPEFVEAYRQAVREARAGKIAEVRAPLNLTSLGAFGVEKATPVVVPPAVGTVFLGAAHPRVVDLSGRLEAVVTLTLAFDHRAANGVGAAAFLREVKGLVEGFEWRTGEDGFTAMAD